MPFPGNVVEGNTCGVWRNSRRHHDLRRRHVARAVTALRYVMHAGAEVAAHGSTWRLGVDDHVVCIRLRDRETRVLQRFCNRCLCNLRVIWLHDDLYCRPGVCGTLTFICQA